ncbi:UBIQUITIN-CONJUGATING ENZYME E2 38-RELATED [Salix viminalis]|uniref:UBIQUITIN-CONJUGATING ENZYME E2 38-RELATED n=1 Tax=Salix viminalis TaxID=40686 RepID=A0A9Q0Z4G2_SALVM|nr:UBIQUITIN-CONJUGATING ENZYME E2 38-RELATED [Salix viminalis]
MALALPSLEPRQQQQQTTARGEIQEIDIFHRFDVVSDSSDHHYLDIIKKENNSGSKKTKGEGDSFSNISSGAYKKIMQEWKILEKHLPDSIYVRVYENRIDLLRAVIIGAAGKKREKWNSSESTVLQVLVSLQALVLNEKPYYNEPGNGVLPGRAIWEKKSNAYSEVRVGFYRNDGSCSSCKSSSHVHVSEKFKGLMGQLYPQLVSGFKRNGASLGDFLEQLKQPVEKKTLSFKGKTVRMVFGKFKESFRVKEEG